MIEVTVDTIRVSLRGDERLILLKDVHDDRQLPIYIGAIEAEAIGWELKGRKRPRPLTHDLLKNCIVALGGELQYILVNDLRDDVNAGGTFYAVLHILQGEREIDVDARPSDSIALAVRAHVPIYVAEKVMDEAGVYPAEEFESNKGQLAVFRDFVDTLDLGDLES